jgi:hypothetical protein
MNNTLTEVKKELQSTQVLTIDELLLLKGGKDDKRRQRPGGGSSTTSTKTKY